MFEHIILEPEHEDLLMKMVEAVRNTPRDHRQKFILLRLLSEGDLLHHRGFPGSELRIFHGDLEILASYGLITVSYGSRGDPHYDVHPLGFRFYEHLHHRDAEPVDQINQEIRGFLDSHELQSKHRSAYRRWHDAASLLWSSDSETDFTSIGHHCREAMQEFAEDVVNEFDPEGAAKEKSNTVARIRSVLDKREAKLGKTEAPFLRALLAYWGTVSDLVQRQEHGGQKEGEPLVWEDARRVVFQTAIVMYEIDRALHR